VPVTVEVNQGYGHGILTGIDRTRGEWVGFVAADGQVDAEDVARLFDAALSAQGDVVAKVRRRFRMDGQLRRLISICYNLYVYALYPGLGSLDVNGSPRLLKRDLLLKMDIQARNWLFDPEMLIKAYHMDVGVLELNVFSRMRCGGVSQVRVGTCFEFFWNFLRFRFTGAFKEWRRDLAAGRLDERVSARLSAESSGTPTASPSRKSAVPAG
jgi:glycosyltransferase involved in cell wall biosynthesis